MLGYGVVLTTCGIEEYYYLPQVPQANINTQFNTSAKVILPSLTGFYYAQYYKIYYRIYLSGYLEPGTIDTHATRSAISPSLASDFNDIYPNTVPTSTSAGTPANILFENRYYYELALNGVEINTILSTTIPSPAVDIDILFPTEKGANPEMSVNDGVNIYTYTLKRSTKLKTPLPDSSFRNSTELNDSNNINSNNNADVAKRDGLSSTRYLYASMYIVAAGLNPVNFTQVFSKPTHISVFKLPEN